VIAHSVPEYRTLPGVALSLDEITELRSLNPSPLAITPSAGQPGVYDLTAGSYVGVVKLDGCTITIHPKLAIDRLLFLLAYGMNPRDWRNIASRFEQRESLLESIVPGFVYQVRQALRRGVLQGYRVHEEALSTVRGRVRFSDQIRRRYGIAPPVEVRYDEFTEDVLENRLIKTALHRLTRLSIRAAWVRRSLREFDLALERVSLVEFAPNHLPDVGYTRLNERYRPAVELARLILRATSFDLAPGRVGASTFLIDMNGVFEHFVVVALREALRGAGGTLVQGGSGMRRLTLDRAERINLQPDVAWVVSGMPRFVGDVKYKRTEGNRGHNPDLYQVLAYAIATDLPDATLIYAKGEDAPAEHEVRHVGKRLRVVALDLELEPDGVLAQIETIACQISAPDLALAR
jgi:5-methylcytosine-specific restriction enzyme subunit McrC